MTDDRSKVPCPKCKKLVALRTKLHVHWHKDPEGRVCAGRLWYVRQVRPLAGRRT